MQTRRSTIELQTRRSTLELPTQASLARNIVHQRENRVPNARNRASTDKNAPSKNKNGKKKIARKPIKRALTIPKSPNLASAKRSGRRSMVKISATSKELLEIKEQTMQMMKERRKFQRYHEATQGIQRETKDKNGNSSSSTFTMVRMWSRTTRYLLISFI